MWFRAVGAERYCLYIVRLLPEKLNLAEILIQELLVLDMETHRIRRSRNFHRCYILDLCSLIGNGDGSRQSLEQENWPGHCRLGRRIIYCFVVTATGAFMGFGRILRTGFPCFASSVRTMAGKSGSVIRCIHIHGTFEHSMNITADRRICHRVGT